MLCYLHAILQKQSMSEHLKQAGTTVYPTVYLMPHCVNTMIVLTKFGYLSNSLWSLDASCDYT